MTPRFSAPRTHDNENPRDARSMSMMLLTFPAAWRSRTLRQVMTWSCHFVVLAVLFAGVTAAGEFDPERTFDRVWGTVDEHFYDPEFRGVDWNACRERYRAEALNSGNMAQLAAVVNRMLNELQTSHTRFYTVDDPEFFFLVSLFREVYSPELLEELFPDGKIRYAGMGAFTRLLDGEYYLTGVIPGYPAAKAGLARGQRLVSVNGRPFHPIRSCIDGVGKSLKVVVQVGPEQQRRVELEPVWIEPQQLMMDGLVRSMRLVAHGEHRIAYARLWSYAGQAFHDRLCHELFHGQLRDGDALVLDLRDGWGGASPRYVNLFNPHVPQLRYRQRDGTVVTADTQWRKPVALLTNGGTRSGKELIAHAFRKYDLGPIVGTQTAGAVTAGRFFLFPDGSGLYLAVSGVEVDGEVLEGTGVSPTIAIGWPLPYGPSEDPQLRKALQTLTKALDSPGSTAGP